MTVRRRATVVLLSALAWSAFFYACFWRKRARPMIDHIPVYTAARIVGQPDIELHIYDQDPANFGTVGPGPMMDVARATGHRNPVTLFVYPPFFAWQMKFLTCLSYDQSRLLVTVASAVFVSLGFLLAWREAAPGLSLRLVLVVGPLVLVLFKPIHTSARLGQITPMIFALIVVSLMLLNRGRETLAGVVLGYITCVKITPGAILFVLLLDRRFRTVVAAAATATALLAGGALVFGTELLDRYFAALSVLSSRGGLAITVNQSVRAFLLRFQAPLTLFLKGSYIPVPAWITWTERLVLAGLCAAVVLTVLRHRRAALATGDAGLLRERNTVVVSAGVLLSIVASPISWTHYHLYLLLPFLWVISLLVRERKLPARRFWCAATAVSWLLLSHDPRFFLRRLAAALTWERRAGSWSVLVSGPLCGVVLLCLIFCVLARWRARGPSRPEQCA